MSSKVDQAGKLAFNAGTSIAGAFGGSAIGQLLIPIPIVGALIGGVVGGYLGSTAAN